MVFFLKIAPIIFLLFIFGCATENSLSENSLDLSNKFLISKNDLIILEKNGFARGYWSQDCLNSMRPKFRVLVSEGVRDSSIAVIGYSNVVEKIYFIKQVGNNLFLLNSVITDDGLYYENSLIYAYYSGNRRVIDASYKIVNSTSPPVQYIKNGVQISHPQRWMVDNVNAETGKFRFCER